MKELVTYMYFNGNCREAMVFYQECLGGELNFTTVGDCRPASQMPLGIRECVLHASLRAPSMHIMGTDLIGNDGWLQGNTLALLVNCDSATELEILYEKLGSGGKCAHPVERTHWGSLFGCLEDRYGNNWILNYQD